MLTDIVRVVPRLAHAVNQIEHEHKEILEAIAALEATTAELGDSAQAQAIREDALNLLRSVGAHRYRGAGLVFDAYNVDIEAAD
jgi:hypothetical protein